MSVFSLNFTMKTIFLHKVELKVCNINDKSLLIETRALYDGDYGMRYIKVTSGPSNIECTTHPFRGQGHINIDGHSCVSNTIDIRNTCDFTNAISGTYHLVYDCYVLPCHLPNYQDCLTSGHLNGQCEYVLEN